MMMLMIRIEIIKCVCFFSTPRCAARSSFVFSLVSPFSLSFCLSVCFSLAFDLSFLWASRRLSRHRQPSSNAASTVFTSCSLRYRFFPFLLLLLLLLLLFLTQTSSKMYKINLDFKPKLSPEHPSFHDL